MQDRDSILVMGLACEKASQILQAIKIYKRYIMSSEYFNEYKNIVKEEHFNKELDKVSGIKDVVRFDKHMEIVCLLVKVLTNIDEQMNFRFSNEENVAYLYEYLTNTTDHSQDLSMIKKFLY